MTVQVERLVATLEARIDKYEKNLKKAASQTDRTFTRIEKRGAQMQKRFASVLSRSTAPLIAALAPAALLQSVRSVSSEIANLAGEAKQAGVSFEAFQELRFATEKSKVGVEALTDGLKEMQLRADEFVLTGKGPAAEAFARLGLNAEELKAALKKPDELFETIIGRLEQLDRAAQIRIADEIFGGTGGEQFVKLLDGGVEAIRNARQEARDLGIVLDEEIADKAVEIDEKFQRIAHQVGTNVKKAIIIAADALSDFLDRFKSIEDRSRNSLEGELATLGKERIENENEILRLMDAQRQSSGLFAKMRREANQQEIDLLTAAQNDLLERETKILDTLAGLSKSEVTPRGGGRKFEPDPLPGGTSRRGGGSKSNSFEQQVRNIKDRVAALNAEASALAQLNPLANEYGVTIDRARIAHELLSAAQRSGLKITPELEAAIEALADQYSEASQRVIDLAESNDMARQSMEDVADIGRDVFGGFISDLQNGKSATEALSNALRGLADRLLNDVLNAMFRVQGAGGGARGGGFLGDLIGGLFGGFGRGSFPAPPVGLFHSGGTAGSATHSRQVSPQLFANAHRYHNGGIAGLAPDEVPAILRRGEPVLPVGTSRNFTSQTSRIQVLLGPGLVGEVLEQAGAQTVEIIDAGNTQRVAAGVIDARTRGFPGV